MDHDADHTHLNKLRTFRDDFLTLSGLTIDQFHEMAERRRSGKPLGDLPNGGGPAGHDGISPEQFRDMADHVKEVSEVVASLQQSNGQYTAVLIWLSQNQGAIQGLLTGSQAAAHAISDAEGTDGASEDERDPASLPEGEVEPLGTDKSTGEVERPGEELKTTTVDAGTEALPAGQLPKE